MPAGQVGVDVVGRRGRPPPAGPARPRAGRAGWGRARSPCGAASRSRSGATSAWTSTSSARLPSSVAATTLPGRRDRVLDRKARAGSATSRRPASTISRTPTSSVAPNRFFEARTRRRVPPRSPSIETHGVDEVLQGLRAGDAPVLRDVADQDDRDPLPLRQLHEAERRLAHLADAPGRAVQLVERRGLDGVDDDRRRTQGAGRREDPLDVVLGEDRGWPRRPARRGGPRRSARRRTWPPDSSPVA